MTTLPHKHLLVFAGLLAAGFLAVTPSFALLSVGYVTKAQAEKLGLEIRAKAAGPEAVRVELAFKTEGPLRGFSRPSLANRIELRLDGGVVDRSRLTAALREDRSKAGRVAVSLTVDRSQVERVNLWVVRAIDGTADVIRLKGFHRARIPGRSSGWESGFGCREGGWSGLARGACFEWPAIVAWPVAVVASRIWERAFSLALAN